MAEVNPPSQKKRQISIVSIILSNYKTFDRQTSYFGSVGTGLVAVADNANSLPVHMIKCSLMSGSRRPSILYLSSPVGKEIELCFMFHITM